MRRIYDPAYRLKRRNFLTLSKYRFRKWIIYWKNAKDIAGGISRDVFFRNGLATQLDVKAVRLGENEHGPANLPRRWCLFAAYSPKSTVTDMMITQLRTYRDAGFSVVFITMSRTISEADKEKLKQVCTYVIHRKSFGRDFGAWAHAAHLLRNEIEAADVLLLANDSNLGPIFPLPPWIEACLEREGIFGMTESLGGGSHLQSYFLVGNGSEAVRAMLDFLLTMRLSHSKWLMIQRGEIGFTRAMQKRGLFVGALISYEDLENALLEQKDLQAELEVLFPGIFLRQDVFDFSKINPENLSLESQRIKWRNRYLLRFNLFFLPLNPSHQLNSVLLRHFKFPFIKAELITKNPGMVPSAPDWRYFITPESPVTEAMIEDHLATLI